MEKLKLIMEIDPCDGCHDTTSSTSSTLIIPDHPKGHSRHSLKMFEVLEADGAALGQLQRSDSTI